MICTALLNTSPCFRSGYLRKCEARAAGLGAVLEQLAVHGTRWSPGRQYQCQPDGGFAPV